MVSERLALLSITNVGNPPSHLSPLVDQGIGSSDTLDGTLPQLLSHAMSAPIRNVPRVASRAFSHSAAPQVSRTGSTSSSASTIGSSAPSAARSKHLKRQQRSKDDALRRAVELYHLTPSFLPTAPRGVLAASLSGRSSAPSASSSVWDASLDTAIYASILNTDSVSRRSPNLVARGLPEYSREQSSRAASVPAFGNTGSHSSSNAKDVQSFVSDLTSTTFLTRREREAAAAAAKSSTTESSSSAADPSSKPKKGGLRSFSDADIAMYERRHNNATGAGVSAGLDNSRYSGAERLTHLDRVTPGANEWYRSQGLNTRSARVRDAIFGTVNGELPGLEIVRERIAKLKSQTPSEDKD